MRLLLTVLLAPALYAQPFTAEDDRRIEADIRARLAKSAIGKENFRIRVQGGVAYWDGVTAVQQRKGAATRMARAAGARRVENNIRVTAPKAPAPKRKAAESAPAPRRVKVRWRDAQRPPTLPAR